MTEVLRGIEEYVNSEIVSPMKELHRRTLTRLQIISDVYNSQIHNLTIKDGGGLRARAQSIVDKQDALNKRILKLKSGLESRKRLTSACLSTALASRSVSSKAEKDYHVLLEEWRDVVCRMDANVAVLRREVKRQMLANNVSSGLSPGPQKMFPDRSSSSASAAGASPSHTYTAGPSSSYASPSPQRAFPSANYSTPLGRSHRGGTMSPWGSSRLQTSSPSPVQQSSALTEEDLSDYKEALKKQVRVIFAFI